MKIGISIFIIGLIIAILGWAGIWSSDGLTNGMLTLFVGYPLMLIGAIVVIIKLVKGRKN
jgi:hypothetical protein